MDKNKIKSYSVWARKKLIKDIKEKAYEIGIEKGNIEPLKKVEGQYFLKKKLITMGEKIQRDELIKSIKKVGYEKVIDDVASTWFNRFIAFRYMELNGCLSIGKISILEYKYKKDPKILIEKLISLSLSKKRILELKEKNSLEDLYKYLLILEFNKLNKIIPSIFENEKDYIELLLPKDLLSEDSVIGKLIKCIDKEVFKEVEVIGWFYQFYISEKKEEVFSKLSKNKKITKEEIPTTTQLFTPKWVVKYMIENSLGRLWIEAGKDRYIKEKWKYYLQDNNNIKTREDFKLEKLKILDIILQRLIQFNYHKSYCV
jgi:hypothetical protein